MSKQRPATAADLRAHMLRQTLPAAYGNDAEKKAAVAAEKKASETTAAQKREKAEADAQFNRHQLRSLALLGDREALQAQHMAAREALAPVVEPTAPEYTPEQLAACTAAGVDPATLSADELAAMVTALNLSK